jgi:CRP-like cAMP-binding protein
MAEDNLDYIDRIKKIFKDANTKVYPKSQLINYQGDPLSNILMIKKGYVKAYTILDSGDTRTILLLSEGDIFPLSFSATLDWHTYKVRYFYQSLTPTELLVLPSEELRQRLIDDTDTMNTYMWYLASSNEAIMTQLEVMKNKKAIDKVMLLLPYLVTKAGKKVNPNVYKLDIRLSHQEIADLSGVTRETTTTLIKQLEKDGIIDQSHGNWLINMKKLEDVKPG